MSANSARPRFAVGADLLPEGGRGAYDSRASRRLADMAACGAGLVRLFVSWPACEPQVGRYDVDALDALTGAVARAGELGMRAVVCLFADLGTGDLLDVGWAGRRDLVADPYLTERAAALAARVAGALAGQRALTAYELADPALVGRFPHADVLATWAAAVGGAVSERDPDRPMALGADVVTVRQVAGIDAAPVASRLQLAVAQRDPICDARFAPGPGLAGPATYLSGFSVRLARTGLPVLAQGAGPVTRSLSVAESAGLVRLELCSALLDRAGAVLAGPWYAAAGPERVPDFREPGETLTGLAADGARGGASARAFTEFCRLVSLLESRRAVMAPERAAVLVAGADAATPAAAGRALRAGLAAFAAAKQSHIPIDVRREGEPLDGLRLVIVPAAHRLSPATWSSLSRFAQQGGTVVLGHVGGDPDPALRMLAGVEHLGPAGPRSVLTCRVAQPGSLGDTVSFSAAIALPDGSVLASAGATVLAADADGRPLVTVHRFGQGRVYHLALPLESVVGALPGDEVPAPVSGLLRGLYRSAAEHAGATGPARCDRTAVEVAVMMGDDGPIALLLNHAAAPVIARVQWERRVSGVRPLGAGACTAVGGPAFRVPLPAHGVAAIAIEEA